MRHSRLGEKGPACDRNIRFLFHRFDLPIASTKCGPEQTKQIPLETELPARLRLFRLLHRTRRALPQDRGHSRLPVEPAPTSGFDPAGWGRAWMRESARQLQSSDVPIVNHWPTAYRALWNNSAFQPSMVSDSRKRARRDRITHRPDLSGSRASERVRSLRKRRRKRQIPGTSSRLHCCGCEGLREAGMR